MKSRFVAVSFAATAIAAGSLAGAAAAAESATSTTTQSSSAEPSTTASKPSVVAPSTTAPAPSTTAKATETAPATTTPKASDSAPATTTKEQKPTGTMVTITTTPTYTAPEWMQPSSYEDQALEVIAKVSVWVGALSAAISALMVLVGAIPGLKENFKQMTGAFK